MFKKQGQVVPQEESVSAPIDLKEVRSTGGQQDSCKQSALPADKTGVTEPSSNIFTDISEYSCLLSKILELASPSMLDSICKLINKDNFWFFIQSMYFPALSPSDLNKIDKTRTETPELSSYLLGPSTSKSLNSQDLYGLKEDLFILENRAIAYHQLGAQQPQQVELDALLGLWQADLEDLQACNDQLIANINTPVRDMDSRIRQLLHPLNYHPEYATFETLELDDQQIQKSKERHQNAARRNNICEVCLVPQNCAKNPLQFCRDCGVGVHSKCNPLSQAEGDYVCYCCDKEVVEEQQLCAVCGCVGGLMFPTQLQSDDELLDGRFALPLVYRLEETVSPTHIKIIKTPSSLSQRFNVLIHASCLKWHNQLFFDETEGNVKGFANINERKSNAICHICEEPEGWCVECQFHGCQKAFHPECARRYGIAMTTVKQSSRLIREIYCDRHRISRQYETMEENRWKKITGLKKLFDSVEKVAVTHVKACSDKKPTRKRDNRSELKSQRKSRCMSIRANEISQMPQCENCLQSFNGESMNVIDQHQFLCDKCL